MIANSKNIQSEDRVLFRRLFNGDSMTARQIHEELLLSVGQIARFMNKYASDDVIEVVEHVGSGPSIRLSESGRQFVLANSSWLMGADRDQFWKQVPESFRQPKIEIGAEYKLSVKELKDFLD